jgi:SAM-dependent methyltransferase
MSTDYEKIGEQYKRAKAQPWRTHVEAQSLFRLLGDLSEKSVLDLACGEGFHTRQIKRHGAERVVGVDSSPKMIELAREAEEREPLGIDYVVADARDFEPPEPFDVVAAAYLLNSARTLEELSAMCRGIHGALKPGGRFVTINSAPDAPTRTVDYTKYGFEVLPPDPLVEGAAYVFRIHLDDDEAFDITNFYLTFATHDQAFRDAGLRDAHWIRPTVSDAGRDTFEPGYWDAFLEQPQVLTLEAWR